MDPPGWVVKELKRRCPDVRLGWMAYHDAIRRACPDAAPGEFALCNLVPSRKPTPPLMYAWGEGAESNDPYQYGPLFGDRPDPLKYKVFPMFTLSIEDVVSGRVLRMADNTPQDVDVAKLLRRPGARQQYARDVMSMERDADGELADYFMSLPAPDNANNVARKHLSEEDRRIVSGEALEQGYAEKAERLEKSNPDEGWCG